MPCGRGDAGANRFGDVGPQHDLPQGSKAVSRGKCLCPIAGPAACLRVDADDVGLTSRCPNSAGKGTAASHLAGTHEGNASKVGAIADSLDAANAADQRCCKSHARPNHPRQTEVCAERGACSKSALPVKVLRCPDAGPCRLRGDQRQHCLRDSCCDSLVAGARMFSGPCELETRVLPSAFIGKVTQCRAACGPRLTLSRTGTDATGRYATMPTRLVPAAPRFHGAMSGLIEALLMLVLRGAAERKLSGVGRHGMRGSQTPVPGGLWGSIRFTCCSSALHLAHVMQHAAAVAHLSPPAVSTSRERSPVNCSGTCLFPLCCTEGGPDCET